MRRIVLFLALALIATAGMWAQKRMVTGVVISSEDNEPVIGASVVVKEQPSLGAATDLDGRFSFTSLSRHARSASPTWGCVHSRSPLPLDR